MNASSTQSGASPPPPPPVPPPPSAPRRRLVRRTDDRTVAGVCAGVADYFDTDPVLVRLITIALTIAGPGIILYGAAWILLPKETAADREVPAGGRPDRRGRSTDGRTVIGAVLIGVAVLIASDGWFGWLDGGLLFAVGLIAIGGYLLLRDRPDDPAPPGGTDPGEASAPSSESLRSTGADAWGSPGGGPATIADANVVDPAGRTTPLAGSDQAPDAPVWAAATTGSQGTAELAATSDAGPDRHDTQAAGAGGAGGAGGDTGGPGGPSRRRGSVEPDAAGHHSFPLATIVIAIALLAVGAVALLDSTDVVHVDAVTVLATGLFVVGVGLVVGAWYGRARWLIVCGVALAVALAAVTVVDLPLEGGIGERSVRPTTVAEAEAEHLLMLGELRLDLTDVPLDDLDGALDVVAHVGMGSLQVVVPDEATLVIEARAGLGELAIEGVGDETGFAARRELTLPPVDTGRPDREEPPELRLDLRAGFGEVQVSRG